MGRQTYKPPKEANLLIYWLFSGLAEIEVIGSVQSSVQDLSLILRAVRSKHKGHTGHLQVCPLGFQSLSIGWSQHPRA